LLEQWGRCCWLSWGQTVHHMLWPPWHFKYKWSLLDICLCNQSWESTDCSCSLLLQGTWKQTQVQTAAVAKWDRSAVSPNLKLDNSKRRKIVTVRHISYQNILGDSQITIPWTWAKAAEAINHVVNAVFQITKEELLFKVFGEVRRQWCQEYGFAQQCQHWLPDLWHKWYWHGCPHHQEWHKSSPCSSSIITSFSSIIWKIQLEKINCLFLLMILKIIELVATCQSFRLYFQATCNYCTEHSTVYAFLTRNSTVAWSCAQDAAEILHPSYIARTQD